MVVITQRNDTARRKLNIHQKKRQKKKGLITTHAFVEVSPSKTGDKVVFVIVFLRAKYLVTF